MEISSGTRPHQFLKPGDEVFALGVAAQLQLRQACSTLPPLAQVRVDRTMRMWVPRSRATGTLSFIIAEHRFVGGRVDEVAGAVARES